MALDLKSFAIGKANGGGSGGITVEKLTATENGTYTAESGKAFNPVVVDVPEPTGSIEITENGTYDVKDVAEAVVDVAGGNPYEIINSIINGSITYFKTNVSGNPVNFMGNELMQSNRLLKLVFFSQTNAVGRIADGNFWGFTNLKYVNVGSVSDFSRQDFAYSPNIKTLINKKKDAICNLWNTNIFIESGISKNIGFVYVPDSLVTDYKSATNWTAYASQIKGFSEAPTYDDTTTYEIGDVCQYNGKFYGYCKEDLTSSVGNAPTGTNEDNAYWEYVDDIVTG